MKHSAMALVKSGIDMYATRQGPVQMDTEFLWLFNSMVEIIKANDGKLWIHTKLYDVYL